MVFTSSCQELKSLTSIVPFTDNTGASLVPVTVTVTVTGSLKFVAVPESSVAV